MKKSLARLDLNLLFILQLLLQEKSVSRTAKRLNVTPSTVSKSLNKLRTWFDDRLFIKTPQGLEPTPLALSMEAELADWLLLSGLIADKQGHEIPRGVKFELVIESPLMLLMFNQLSQRIYAQYPEAKIKVRNWDDGSLEAIIRGEADIGFTGRESHPLSRESLHLLPNFVNFEVLFSDLPVVYLREDHLALQQEWNLETFLQYAHIGVFWEHSEIWALDNVLQEMGTQRSVSLTLPSFEQSLFMAAQPGHTMLATAPSYCGRYAQQLNLGLVTRPIPLAKAHQDKLIIPFTMIWHKRNAYSSKLKWLKHTIRSLYDSGEFGSGHLW